jgi:transposase
LTTVSAGAKFNHMMKMTPEESRQRVFEAMMKVNGDRTEAAKALGVSLRTFYRYLDELEMGETIIKMGWDKKPGPVKGQTRGLDIVRMQILEHIRGLNGRKVDFAVLTQEIFGEDDRVGRSRVFSAMEQLRKTGKIDLNEETGVWSAI